MGFHNKSAGKQLSNKPAEALAEETGYRTGQGHVLEIVDLCVMAGRAEMAGDYIRKGLTPADVRADLLSLASQNVSTAKPKNLEQNPLVKRATKLAVEADKARVN